MKAKFIYEKFVEDSDPIRDMGIGAIKEILDKITNEKWNVNYSDRHVHTSDLFIELYNRKMLWLIDFVIQDKQIDLELKHSDKWAYILGNLAYSRQWGAAKYIISKGANLQKTIQHMNSHGLKETTKNLRYLKKMLSRKHNIKESINEKFKDKSDPIQDMGIGLVEILKNIHTKKELEEKFPDAIPVEKRISRYIYAINKEQTLFISVDNFAKGPKPHYFMDYDPNTFEVVRIFEKLPDDKENTIWYKPYN